MAAPTARRWVGHGRTRCPKNLASDDHSSPTEVSVVLVATLDAVTDGYATENQRYLHVLLIDKNVGTSLTVTLYGYNHAFGKWAPLNTLNGSTAATVVKSDIGDIDEGAQEADDRELVTFEIAGVDRVAFVGVTAHVRCYAACSTF
jgi:hypothetical protein